MILVGDFDIGMVKNIVLSVYFYKLFINRYLKFNFVFYVLGVNRKYFWNCLFIKKVYFGLVSFILLLLIVVFV